MIQACGAEFYLEHGIIDCVGHMQVSVAVPVIMDEVFCMLIPIIIDVLTGTLATILTVPGETHVAIPFILMVAIMLFMDAHVSPSALESVRVVLLLNRPIALKVIVPIIPLPIEPIMLLPIVVLVMETLAVEGLTLILINLG